MWPVYDRSCNSLHAEGAPFSVFVLIIILKVVVPLFYIFKSGMKLDFISIIFILGFYIYMISILYPTMNNADLRRRLIIV